MLEKQNNKQCMTKTNLIDKVPIRIRLFFAFSSFAWVSLFKPDEGLSFIQDALEGEVERTIKNFREKYIKENPYD